MALNFSRYFMLLISLTFLNASKKCRTLNGEEGTCVEYYKCPIANHTHMNLVFYDEDKDFLIDSYCGWWSMPKICCGKFWGYTNQHRETIEKYYSTCGSKIDKDIRWLVQLKDNCYGFLITDRYIVGKASCMDNIRAVKFVHQNNFAEIILIIKHPLASIKKEYYDIGLMKLRQAVPYNPICIQLEEPVHLRPTMHIQNVGNKFWIVDPNNLKTRNFVASIVQLCPAIGYKSLICSGPCQSNNEFSLLVSEDFSYIQGLTMNCNKNALTSINIWYFQWWIASNIK